MPRSTVLLLLVIASLLVVSVAAVGADGSYTITIENGETDVPERTVTGLGQEFTVTSIAAISPGTEINYQISTSSDAAYRVVLINDDQEIEDFNSGGESGTFETEGLAPGTYAVAVDTGDIETIQPVVITSYETALSVPSEAGTDDGVSAEISIAAHDNVDAASPETVQAVIANGSMNEAITAEETDDGEYVADLGSGYEPGEYRVYALVRSSETVESGQFDVIGMSEEQTLTVVDSGTGDDGQDGTGGGGQDGGDAPTDDNVGNENSSETGVESDIVQEGTIETESGVSGSRVSFESGSPVEEIAFESEVSGSVNVTTRESAPTDIDPSPGTTVQVSEITVPEAASDDPATIRLTVSADRLEALNVTADELRVNRFANGTWEGLATTLVEERSEHIVLEAETPGFSYFAVSAVSDQGTESDGDDETGSDGAETGSDGDTNSAGGDADGASDDGGDEAAGSDTTDDSVPGFGILGALVSVTLFAVSTLARTRRSA